MRPKRLINYQPINFQLMKKILLLFVAMLATTTVWAADFITDVMVIGGSKSVVNSLKDTYTSEGWTVIDKDLNAGCGSGSDYIYLLYKTESNESLDIGAFITGFYISDASGTAPDNVTYNGHTYTLVSYDGSDYFKGTKGDLNSHCGSSSAYIHLYYTTDDDVNYSSTAVTAITFDAIQSGAIGVDGDSEGYDLNTGCGSSSDYIYMHTGTGNKGWTISMNSAHTQCTITGYQGTKTDKSSITIPKYIDDAPVTGFSGSVFSGFTNLETMIFYEDTQVTQMASMQGCSKFKNIITGSVNNTTPASMTSIPASAFVGTAIEKLHTNSVTQIGEHAFDGCNLSWITIDKPNVLIGDYAFANISNGQCIIISAGDLDRWNPMAYMYSYWTLIRSGDHLWYCSWGGSYDNTSNNHLFWTLKENHLKINCATSVWQDYPEEQIIEARSWYYYIVQMSVQTLTMEHVYSLKESEFCNLRYLQNVYIDPTLHSIGEGAFYGCNDLKDIWFDGNQQQWDAVAKDANWKDGTSNLVEHWHCTVTFNPNGHGTAPAAQNIEWSNRDKATEPTAPTASGYEFKGWYTDAACTNQWDFNNEIPGDMTLYAKWELEQYTFDSTTGALTLNWGEFNKDNKWGDDVPAADVTSVTATNEVSFTGDCSNMFTGFYNCTSMDLNSVNTDNVTSMKMLFTGCAKLTSIDLSNWNTSNVTDMYGLFLQCNSLDSLDLSNFNTSKVTDMSYMFDHCMKLKKLNVSGWDTGNVTEMPALFSCCYCLKTLDLSGWSAGKVTKMYSMFAANDSLTTIYADRDWNIPNSTSSSGMFAGCTSLVGGKGTTYDSWCVDKEYARIDGGPDSPGYFTDANSVVVVPGDVNGDGNVTSADVTVLYNWLLNNDNSAIVNGDQNGDGSITSADVTFIYNILLGSK